MPPDAHPLDELALDSAAILAEAREINAVLRGVGLSLPDRTGLLARCIVKDTRGADSLMDLALVISVLARRLSPGERLAVRWELINAAEELRDLGWN